MATTAIEKQAALTPEPESEQGLTRMLERIAANPEVPVDKLERLIAMQERIIAQDARADFFAAFSAMQGELPTIGEKGQIIVNGQVRSSYARNEDIQEAVRPILQRHGFALSFRNEFKDGLLKITGILSHRSGHTEQDEFIARPDDSGQKNNIQQLGSTRSYGQRYTTMALLNIATRGEDDDGHRAGKPAVVAPVGFEDWWLDMNAVAGEGIKKLEAAWLASKKDFQRHVMATNRPGWEALKRQASKVTA
jgi:hypothetical protein